MAIISAEFVPEPPKAFEWNLPRIWVHQKEHSEERTWAVRILFGFTLIPSILTLLVDLGRYLLFQAGYLNGKSFSLIDLALGKKEEPTAPVEKVATKSHKAASRLLSVPSDDPFVRAALLCHDNATTDGILEAERIHTLLKTSFGALRYIESHQNRLSNVLESEDLENFHIRLQALIEFRQWYEAYSKEVHSQFSKEQWNEIAQKELELAVGFKQFAKHAKGLKPKDPKTGAQAVSYMIWLVQECDSKPYENHDSDAG